MAQIIGDARLSADRRRASRLVVVAVVAVVAVVFLVIVAAVLAFLLRSLAPFFTFSPLTRALSGRAILFLFLITITIIGRDRPPRITGGPRRLGPVVRHILTDRQSVKLSSRRGHDRSRGREGIGKPFKTGRGLKKKHNKRNRDT